MPDAAAEQEALRRNVGAFWLERDFLVVEGPDSLKFLQGQLSQDIDMAIGSSAWSLLLQPQGKMVALLRVARRANQEFILDTDGGWGDVVEERLNRFKIRVKATIETQGWRCVALRGPRAHDFSAGVLGLDADWPGLPGLDIVGDDPAVPSEVPICSADAYEAVRIEAGVPMMGRELDERTIPAEAGIVDRTASFTKGCYTGQELVARIDSRGGNVPRRLRGIVVSGETVPPAGATLTVDGKAAGTLTSVAHSAALQAPVGLGFVGRAVSVPAEGVVEWDGGSAPARVDSLPLVP
ncbi:MAG TPA: glycine cleavage T C-terminal barrel domain-containing protein [Acidimicrobiales bacterium]|jgi:folate-binding protein YgfZ